MNEINAAFESLLAEGKRAALATVIAIEGSAYRRPGARLLIAEDGRTWGGVSGGCLERDVARRGREVINSCVAQRRRYDTADDESLASGTSTGCGGAIDIFIQPITAENRGPIKFFHDVIESRRAATVATVLRLTNGGSDICVGTTALLSDFADWPIAESVSVTSQDGSPAKSPVWVDSTFGIVESRTRCGQSIEIFVERLLPPQALVIVGAGPDARAVATLAKSLGWHVTVVAARPATSVRERFASIADRIEVTGADEPLSGVQIPADAALVLMTHNVVRDQLALAAIPHEVAYLGLLGPRHRTEHILDSLGGRRRASLASPIGLDIGAETPEEIGLAIVAEIQASLRGASGRPLSQLIGPIHSTTRPPTARNDLQSIRATSCQI